MMNTTGGAASRDITDRIKETDMSAITNTLEACADYFEARAVAEFLDVGTVRPNEEMNLLIMVRAVLNSLPDNPNLKSIPPHSVWQRG
jgi:hypothetical protein